MPTLMFSNQTNEHAWVRVYDLLKYVTRSKLNDPYRENFVVEPNATLVFKDHAYEMVFKAVLLGKATLNSGNLTLAKPTSVNEQAWQHSKKNIYIDIDFTHNAVNLT